jgi:hypothetical protein
MANGAVKLRSLVSRARIPGSTLEKADDARRRHRHGNTQGPAIDLAARCGRLRDRPAAGIVRFGLPARGVDPLAAGMAVRRGAGACLRGLGAGDRAGQPDDLSRTQPRAAGHQGLGQGAAGGHPAGDGGDPAGRIARCRALPLVGGARLGRGAGLCSDARGGRHDRVGAERESVLRARCSNPVGAPPARDRHRALSLRSPPGLCRGAGLVLRHGAGAGLVLGAGARRAGFGGAGVANRLGRPPAATRAFRLCGLRPSRPLAAASRRLVPAAQSAAAGLTSAPVAPSSSSSRSARSPARSPWHSPPGSRG